MDNESNVQNIVTNNTRINENKFRLLYFLAGLAVGAICLLTVAVACGGLKIGFPAKTNILSQIDAVLVKYGVEDKNVKNELHKIVLADAPLSKAEEILDTLDKFYVNDYDKDRIIENMYQGLVYGVGDPYTVYMDRDAYKRFSESTEGTYAGIGVVVSVDEATNSIVVVTPYEGCPGERAGILPNDKIVKVNGYDVTGDVLDEAVSMMKGDPGTHVLVTIKREGVDTLQEFDLVREKIDVPTVSHKLLENNIGYIRITQFDRVTYNQFKTAFDDLKSKHITGLILDLRNNPGGLLNIVTQITDLLVPKATIVYTEDKQGVRNYTYSDDNHIEVPLIVLVNGSSASASEVLSGAVKDLKAGELLGSKTFGKGLVQNIYELSDGSALKITIAKYYTPSGVCIQGVGIEPDYPVEMSDELSVKISSLTLEEDVQLSKAIEVMNGKIGKLEKTDKK